MTWEFDMWQDGSCSPAIIACADGASRGAYHSIAQAYTAFAGCDVEELVLELSAAKVYALPAFTPAPENVCVKLWGDYAPTNLLTCGAVLLQGDMEWENINLIPPPMQMLDVNLDSYTLTLGGGIQIGYANYDTVYGAPDWSSMSHIHGGKGSRLMIGGGGGGNVIRDIFGSIQVDELVLQSGRLILRGWDNHHHVKRLCMIKSEEIPTMTVGSNETLDRITMEVDEYVDEGNWLHLNSCEGQSITIHRISSHQLKRGGVIPINVAEIKGQRITEPLPTPPPVTGHINFHISKDSWFQLGDVSGLPQITLDGEFDTEISYNVQYYDANDTTDVTIEKIASLGSVLIHAPDMDNPPSASIMVQVNDDSNMVQIMESCWSIKRKTAIG